MKTFTNRFYTKKPVYQLWDEASFQNDVGVRKMDSLSRLMYRSLLQSAFYSATRPYLPTNDSDLVILSGAENEKQWLKHKNVVLKMFYEIEIDGEKLYAQKRLVRDWKQMTSARKRLSKIGQAGGIARAKAAAQLSKDNIREDKIREDKIIEGEKMLTQKQNNPLKYIHRVCLEKFEEAPKIGGWAKGQIKALADLGKGNKLCDAFDAWLVANPSPDMGTLITDFLKVSEDFMLQSNTAAVTDTRLNDLTVELYNIGDIHFTGSNRNKLALLLQSYTSEEIASAFREFIGDKDVYNIRFAPKEFVEGACVTTINTQRKRKIDDERMYREMEAQTAAARAQLQAEREAALNAPEEYLEGIPEIDAQPLN